MSVIKIINEQLVIISHEKYTKNIYRDIEGKSFCFKRDLFAINEPFKTYNSKLNKKINHNEVDSSLILNYPNRVYNDNTALIKQLISKSTCKNKLNLEIIERNSRKRTSEEVDTKVYNYPNQQTLNTLNEINKLATTPKDTFSGSNSFEHPIIRALNEQMFLFPPKCTFLCTDIKNMNKLEGNKYNVIVMDPPWTNKAIRRKNKKQLTTNTTNGYNFLTNDEIQQIPIENFLSEDGVVFIWCTNSATHQKAVDGFFAKWNLIKVGLWYWLKVTTQGEPVIPFSNENLHMKQPYEVVIIGVRKDMALNWKAVGEGMFVSVPSGVHSHKPPLSEVIEIILEKGGYSGYKLENLKCLEVFARSLLPGWMSIGNEVLKLQNLFYYEEVNINKNEVSFIFVQIVLMDITYFFKFVIICLNFF